MAKSKSQASVTDAQILKAAGQFSQSKQDLDDTRMEHANLCKDLDNRGIHRPALKLVHKLKTMDIAKAQDFMRSFTRYADVLELTKRLESQPDILDEEEEEAESTDAAPAAFQPEAVH